jgi:hypothetical protein
LIKSSYKSGIMKIVTYVQKFLKISSFEKWLFIKGFVIVLILICLIALFRLKTYVGLFKLKPGYLSPENERYSYVRYVRKTLKRIEKAFPFRLSCLVKSLTFKLLLNSLGVENKIEISIKKTIYGSMMAHAYVITQENKIFMNNKRFRRLCILI